MDERVRLLISHMRCLIIIVLDTLHIVIDVAQFHREETICRIAFTYSIITVTFLGMCNVKLQTTPLLFYQAYHLALKRLHDLAVCNPFHNVLM